MGFEPTTLAGLPALTQCECVILTARLPVRWALRGATFFVFGSAGYFFAPTLLFLRRR